MTATRVAVIGAGVIARRHLVALRGSDVIAPSVLVGRSSAARDLAAEFGLPFETRLDDVARHGTDFAAICTPSGTHAEIANACMKLGLDVLVEKPLDVTEAAAGSLVAVAEQTGRLAACVFQLHFQSSYRTVFQAVERGLIGTVEFIALWLPWFRERAYYDASQWRGTRQYDGGVLLNQTSHYLDIVLQIARRAGARRVSVSAELATSEIHQIESETISSLTMAFHPRPIVSIAATTMAAPGFPVQLIVAGTRGSAVVISDRLADSGLAPVDGLTPEDAWSPAAHLCVYDDFIRARRDDTAPAAPARQALDVNRVVAAAYRSAASGSREVTEISA